MYKKERKKKKKKKEMFPQNVKNVSGGNSRGYVGVQKTKNAFIISQEQVNRNWTIITGRKQASN